MKFKLKTAWIGCTVIILISIISFVLSSLILWYIPDKDFLIIIFRINIALGIIGFICGGFLGGLDE